jgi:hypothetical protein
MGNILFKSKLDKVEQLEGTEKNIIECTNSEKKEMKERKCGNMILIQTR